MEDNNKITALVGKMYNDVDRLVYTAIIASKKEFKKICRCYLQIIGDKYIFCINVNIGIINTLIYITLLDDIDIIFHEDDWLSSKSIQKTTIDSNLNKFIYYLLLKIVFDRSKYSKKEISKPFAVELELMKATDAANGIEITKEQIAASFDKYCGLCEKDNISIEEYSATNINFTRGGTSFITQYNIVHY